MLVIHNGNVKFYFENTFQQYSAIDIKRICELTPGKQFPKMCYYLLGLGFFIETMSEIKNMPCRENIYIFSIQVSKVVYLITRTEGGRPSRRRGSQQDK
jgi:hypothetical protein